MNRRVHVACICVSPYSVNAAEFRQPHNNVEESWPFARLVNMTNKDEKTEKDWVALGGGDGSDERYQSQW